MPLFNSSFVLPVLMLLASNVFMTFAWYGHLKFKTAWLPLVILVSWGIAFVEYCLAVPANRWGSEVYSAAQLKTIQEVVTLLVFAALITFLREPCSTNGPSRYVMVPITEKLVGINRLGCFTVIERNSFVKSWTMTGSSSFSDSKSFKAWI